MSSAADPTTVATRAARQADAAGRWFARGLSLVWRDTERRVRALLAARGPAAGSSAAASRQAFRGILRDAGYDALVTDATEETFDLLARTLLAESPSWPRIAPPRIEALRVIHRLELLDEGDAAASALWQAAMRGLYARRPVEAILEDLATVIDRTDAQIATLYDTTVSIYTRQVALLDDEGAAEARFRYVGPDDAKTRPFCEARVNQVFTRAQIEAMDNGQIDNVLLSGGGYNCRHLWMPLSQLV